MNRQFKIVNVSQSRYICDIKKNYVVSLFKIFKIKWLLNKTEFVMVFIFKSKQENTDSRGRNPILLDTKDVIG